MKTRCRSAVGALLLAILASPIGSEAEGLDSDLLTEDYTSSMRSGFEHLYNLDYEESRKAFERLKADYPEHPGPPLDLAIVVWQRELFRRNDLSLDRFTSPSHFTDSNGEEMPPEERRQFQRNLEESKRLSKSILNETPDDPDGLYYLGAALGVEASFALTIEGDKLKALGLGRDARDRHRRVVEMAPEYIDAYLTLGMYQYLADNLPWYIKWLAAIVGIRGDEERGLEYLKSVATRGRRSQDVARLLRMVLLVREERLETALDVARGLKRDFPRNYLFALNEVQLLERMEREEQVLAAYKDILEKLDEGVPNYQLAPRPDLRLRIAERLVEHGRLEIAEPQFRSVLESSEATAADKAWSHLNLGRIDAQKGRSAEARRHFEQALELAESDETRDEARRRLEELS